MVGKQPGRRCLDGNQSPGVVGPGRSDGITGWQGWNAVQPSYPSTMTISASATVTRIALAAWYSGEL